MSARESRNKARKVNGYVGRKSEGISDWSAVNMDENDYGKLQKSIRNARKRLGNIGKDGKRA